MEEGGGEEENKNKEGVVVIGASLSLNTPGASVTATKKMLLEKNAFQPFTNPSASPPAPVSANESDSTANPKAKKKEKKNKKKQGQAADEAFPGIPLYESDGGKNANAPFPGIPLHAVTLPADEASEKKKEKKKKVKESQKKEPAGGEDDAPFPGIRHHEVAEKDGEKEKEKEKGEKGDAPFPGIPLHISDTVKTKNSPRASLKMSGLLSPRASSRASTFSTPSTPHTTHSPPSPPSSTTPSTPTNPTIPAVPPFGISIEEVLRFEETHVTDTSLKEKQAEGIPIILTVLSSAILRLGGGEKEGIFRASGTLTEMKDVEERLCKGDYTIPESTDPHVVASLLKKWVHGLNPSLIPDDSYDLCLQSGSQPWQSVKLISQLPPLHGKVIGYLISYIQNEFLLEQEVVKKTRMDLHSIATTWSPCFFHTPDREMQEMVLCMKAETRFVLNLLTHMNGVLINETSETVGGDRVPLSRSEGDLRDEPSPSTIAKGERGALTQSAKGGLGRSISVRFKRFQESSDKKAQMKRKMMEARKQSISEAVKESKQRGDIIHRETETED